ncbi:MAG: T9SS type A sorting domain-containing protein [Melioribacteraceae bacterium]|nr:T9SS type A sorting domain-containing protein [Melioribacteraceae bacterium]
MKKILTLLLIISIHIMNYSQELRAVYVLSEGGFSTGTSMLSKINIEEDYFIQSIFNPGKIGLFPDGLIHSNNKLYLTEQGNFGGPGKIYELETDGTIINSIEVGTNPYSLAISNNKIYITSGPASTVSVINQSDFSYIKTINVGAYPQEIVSHNGKVYVANNSLYGGATDSTVSVIDAATDEVIGTIHGRRDPVSFSTISLAISNDNHLLFACPGSEAKAIIYKVELDGFTKIDSFAIPVYGLDRDICVDKNSNNLFFKSSTNEIVQLDLVTKDVNLVVSDQNLLSINGYAYEHMSGRHYIADAKDFTSNGSLNIYDNDGNFLNAYETSISPRRILMKYDVGAVSVESEFITSDFILEQNYPNPFNPTTIIRYTIPNQDADAKIGNSGRIQNVKLGVYDALGNLVQTLENGRKEAGVYEILFEASDLASGIYYYRFQTGNFIETRKMILLK